MNRFSSPVISLASIAACLCSGIAFGGNTINVPADYETIPDAIAAAGEGDTIVIADNTYLLTEQLTITNAITLKGSSAEKCILKQTKKSSKGRVINLNCLGARVEKLTITGGQIGDNYTNGGGVLIGTSGGTVSHCIISNNYLSGYNHFGGGVCMAGGRLEFCKVVGNYAGANYGGGNDCRGGGVGFADTLKTQADMPVVESCLIAGNKCGQRGGGLSVKYGSYGAVLNSTIAGNTASMSGNAGGGVFTWSEYFWMTNCLVAGNYANNDTGNGKPNWASEYANSKFTSKIAYCLYGDSVKSVLGGATCIIGNPKFKEASTGDYHLTGTSDAIGKADVLMSQTLDLDGVARGETPAIGCYEYDAGSLPFSCEPSFSPTSLMKDKPVSVTTSLVNPPAGIVPVYTWSFTRFEDSFVTNVVRYSGTESITLNLPGKWSVSLVVSDANSETKTDATKCEGTLLTGSFTNYVTSAANEHSGFPYDTPENAATSPDDILDYLVDGSVVILDEGTHHLSNVMKLEKSVKVYGQGRDKTTVRPTKKSDVRHQLVYLNNPDSLVFGVTLAGCVSDMNCYYVSGMAACIGVLGGTIRDCRVKETSWRQVSSHGALASVSSAGLIDNVIIECNTNNCFNQTGKGAGLYLEKGTARNCLIRNNVATGAGRNAVYMYSCARLENCTIVGNYDANVTNSAALYIDNSEESGGYVRNCVFADNVVGTNGDAVVGQPNWMLGKAKVAEVVDHCCWVGSATLGTLCADGAKAAFADAANGDYRLTLKSSCRNAGLDDVTWMKGSKDLDGNPRIFGRCVDIGAYELQYGPGLSLFVR